MNGQYHQHGYQQQQQQHGYQQSYHEEGYPLNHMHGSYPQSHLQETAAPSSYNDDGPSAKTGHSHSPREYLHTPVYSPTPGDRAHAQQFGEAAEKSPALPRRAKGERRRCCGNGRYCWCCSRRCCCIFLPVLAVVLVALGVTLFFVFPRIPKVDFVRVDVAQQNQQSQQSRRALGARDTPIGGVVGDLLDNVSINRDGVVTVPLVIHLNVTNPNYIPWTIHNVTVIGYLANSTAGGPDFPVGTGGLPEPFHMPRKSVGNDMGIRFNFRLTTDNTNYLDAARTVQAACTAGGPDLRFHYKANVILRAISWLGIKPGISDTIHFPCPISEIEALGIKISDLTGITAADIAGVLH
ncbi:hypothetical protein H4R18_002475 [Coemansia javaensis]|uniref:Late embryogenesis abundant protein LEA-2 subgroup domain-containing protein n=1 Tax=Coemansia javaensis TaxID=2761396 RepID=A0A9W8HEI7_9FUNG|nr:hypothetical protein H4R18_002475 [Coemansia javaensis]